jgi:hypothetical protein
MIAEAWRAQFTIAQTMMVVALSPVAILVII